MESKQWVDLSKYEKNQDLRVQVIGTQQIFLLQWFIDRCFDKNKVIFNKFYRKF